MQTLFWLSIATVLYTYVGYGLITGLWNKLFIRPKNWPLLPDERLPSLSLIVPAWNEAEVLREKIANSLALDYPKDRLQIIVITDGSTDETVEIAATARGIEHLHRPERSGKVGALNRARGFLRGEISVITDANTMLQPDCLRRLVRYFQDPRVGCVAGEKRVQAAAHDAASSTAAAGEGAYWRYESQLKAWDANIYSVTGAAGELMALRTALFEPIPPDTIIEDYYISGRINLQGYRVAYAPDAYAVEAGSANTREESKRKIRIAAGGFQASWRLRGLLNPLRYGVFSWQIFSHRIMRWTLAPLALALILLSNVFLAFSPGGMYRLFLLAQLAFYGWALLGRRYEHGGGGLPGMKLAWFFVMMHWSVFLGFARWVKGQQKVTWERAKRA